MSIEKLLAFGIGPVLFFLIIIFMLILSKKPVDMDAKNLKNQKVSNKSIVEKEQFDKLKAESDNMKSEIQKKDAVIDSLSKLVASQEAEFKIKEDKIVELTNQLSAKKDQEESAKELAKTFAAMKTDEMGPILQKLNDKTVMLIYENMNSRVRKNFLLALSSQRAAKLTQSITSLN